ncbi:4-alpha-glucanotransferase [Dyadobacter sp. CY312]|uniref:4-alpha-glucanotransferase n=1 Tax=Dyadobacter sp. CY312 TaxID=2907303 RepID=UPI001F48D79E|nr:4-alpha-glucanotransferase [Dyadobacter sp. CY312]MCE7039084.1 hypothetical protein [Dyadobacter sp. CY312]
MLPSGKSRLAYSSVAKMAVIPIQDLLNLDESCKMNGPGSSEFEWTSCKAAFYQGRHPISPDELYLGQHL